VRTVTAAGAAAVYTETSQVRGLGLDLLKLADPEPARAGEPLTYTLYLTNTGSAPLTATVTDTLPAHVTPTGVLTWPIAALAADGVWTQTVVVTVEPTYLGTLTNVVQAETAQGEVALYRTRSEVIETPKFWVSKQAHQDPVLAGTPLTYTILLGNMGNVSLTATVYDTLPEQVAAGGLLVWTAALPPGEIWTKTFSVAVSSEYSGPLVNIVWVRAAEGATGGCSEVSTSIIGRPIYLPTVLKTIETK